MGMERRDGSIQSSNLPAHNRLAKNKVDRDFGIYRCMITRVLFVDDAANLTFDNKQVIYEAVILGGSKEGQILQNVKAMNEYGGEFNYAEKIYRPIETKKLNEKRISEHKGDIVFVGFLQGNTRAPVIIGGGVQPFDKDSTGAKKADGFRMRKQYNGVFEEINKKGEYEFTRKGGKLNETTGVFTPSTSDFEARFKFFENKMVWEDPNSSITFEKKEKRLTTKVGDSYTETIDGTAKKVTKMMGSVKMEFEDAAKKATFTAGTTVIEIDGNSGKIKLTSDFVDIGKAVSDFAVLFTELATAFNTHTHPFQYFAGPAPAAGVSQPPVAPLLQSVASATIKLQP